MRRFRKIQNHPSLRNTRGRTFFYLLAGGFLLLYLGTAGIAASLKATYEGLQTAPWQDRNGVSFSLALNERGNLASPPESVPPLFETLLVRKEDRFFYYHLGFNPLSMVRGLLAKMHLTDANGSSTITQQLVKILLENEQDRTVVNKLKESFYAVALELHASKREILTMYEGAAYFGRSRQGITEASLYFFTKKPSELGESEMLQLITALGSPSSRFPGSARGTELLPSVASATGSDVSFSTTTTPVISAQPRQESSFEMKTLDLSCDPCDVTIDTTLTEKIRDALRYRIEAATDANVTTGAVVVLKLPENELLAMVGSPNPKGAHSGAQINMALEPRPIGSTAKPFIYVNAFSKGARPYTLVDDEEYSYKIGTGFAFYPKNFDGKFRGEVTLHNALSNSLNVPAVKVLEYVGLPPFYRFLSDSLGFIAKQPLERYELGIALGALEMDLLTLSHFFTVFPAEGMLRPLTLEKAKVGDFTTPMEQKLQGEKRIADGRYVQLINKILSDREMAVEQFGLRSNLTLPYKNYALKTGTSGNYHDSWTIGYTPDFLVGVWLGNSDNTAMRELTGQNGAGAVWQDVMMLMYASEYNHDTPFRFNRLKEFSNSGSIEYGLAGDDYDAPRNLMKNSSLILSPHDGDTIELTGKTIIPLVAREAVDWFVDGKFLTHAKEANFSPLALGKIKIEVKSTSKNQSVHITVTESQ